MPLLQKCGAGFLRFSQSLQKIDLPQLQRCGDDFLFFSQFLQEINLPKLEEIGFSFIGGRIDLDSIKGGRKR